MSASEILQGAVAVSLAMVSLALLLIVWRLLRGPTLADRVLALDTLNAAAMGLIGLIALRSGAFLLLDIAVALGLVGVVATAAFARLIAASKPEKRPETPKISRRKGRRP